MTTIARARDHDRAEPVCLVEITLLNYGPTLYLSDRNITVSGQVYEDYLDELSGLGEELRRADSTGLNGNITLIFKNDTFQSYGYLVEIGQTHPFEGAGVTVKECYLEGSGAVSSVETVFKGFLDEPRKIDVMSFECSVSSAEFRANL